MTETQLAPGFTAVSKCDTHNYAALFALILPLIRETARKLGYAIALHGSMRRDLDLIAVPWVDDAVAPEVLVQMLIQELGGKCPDMHKFKEGDTVGMPMVKPHGRHAYSIQLNDYACWIDLSITSRASS